VGGAGSPGSVVLGSVDGRTWQKANPAGSTGLLVSLVASPAGFVAVGRDPGTGATARLWQSNDGARWTPLAGFPPIGPAACRDGCTDSPDGLIVGDHAQLIALRAGPDAAAWESSDGSTWHPLRMTGDLPSAAGNVVVFPGGILVLDGSTAWYGAASGD